ncbi:MAG: hypothetical protein DBX59_00585 [Bacillota bacterium]|nr:MAG: hypothetical protein DBX59_00585 [Bacillota bacterium]
MKKLYILMAGLMLASAFMLVNNPPLFAAFSPVSEVYSADGSMGAGSVYGVFETVNGKSGESCRVDRENFSLQECIKYFQAEIIFTERVENTVSVYLYSPKIKRYKIVKGEKINLHVAFAAEYVALGSPLVYGSY